MERLLSGTTAWLVTVLASAAVFASVVYGIGQLLSPSTGLTGGVAAFVSALVLLPLQRHIAALVGRVVDQIQNDPELVVTVARTDGGWARLDGTTVPEPDGFAIEAGGDVIARLDLGWDSIRARRRIADLAKAAWVPIEVAWLRLVLQEALSETEASRRRLVEASPPRDGVWSATCTTGSATHRRDRDAPAPAAGASAP